MPEMLRSDYTSKAAAPPIPSVAFPRPNSAVFRFIKEPRSGNPLRVVLSHTPTFAVPEDSGISRWWGSLKAACAPVKVSKRGLAGPLRLPGPARPYFRGRSLSMAVAFHLAAILLIIYVHQEFPNSVSAFDSLVSQPEVIYYRVPVRQLPKTLPHIAAAGPGGNPLSGTAPTQMPTPGGTASVNVLTIVSKPAHPDNSHQTIIQPSSPPELKITADLKLPNIILGKPMETPKTPLQFNPMASRPAQRDWQSKAEAAPAPTPETAANPMTFLTPSNFKPQMPVPAASGATERKNTSGTENIQAPNVQATSGESLALAVISTDPGVANASDIMLPPGNRSGEFSTSASDSLVGSPGADRTGVTAGGVGNKGKGGDGSTGPGSASSGGGGISVSESVTINGAGTNSSGSGILGAALARGIVYPVPAAFNIRKNSLIVSAGSIGGGGLNAYGVLHCGKIYTIFLAMPGKNWTMQYCGQSGAEAAAAAEAPTVAHFGEGIVPPQAESKFDFQRIPLSPDKTGKLIILKGLLRADGFIDELQVYQGVAQEMDDNARLAFSQWKFKPALREGKPIAVQVLVGIPAMLPPPTVTSSP